MPRAERPLDADGKALTGFAAELRRLRERAGSPPYRELARRAHFSSTTLSDAAGGRRVPSLAVTLAYVRACGGDATEWERRWRTLVAESARETDVENGTRVDQDNGTAPYRGLASYQAEDKDWFFGRERLIDEVADAVATKRFVMVFGASGAGKSSLLRAGLVPRLTAQGSARVVVFTPGPDPIGECAVHLAPLLGQLPGAVTAELATDPRNLNLVARQALVDDPPETELVLVVDQFEELFTLCRTAADRSALVTALVAASTAANSRCRVVLGVRADFYSHCLQDADLAAQLREGQVAVGPMSVDELRRAIVEPARRAGCVIETSLLTSLVAQAHGRTGVLPLLSHALLETWRRRKGNTLTHAGFDRVGGIGGALAQSAEAEFAALDEPEQQVVKDLFLRLVALGEGTEDTKRRVGPDELDDSAEAVLGKLVDTRLVVQSDKGVEITHETLINAWPRLRTWLDEDRQALRVHRELTDAAAVWRDNHRDPGTLLRGTRLAVIKDWARNVPRANQSEQEFLDASVNAEAAERATEVRNRRRLHRLAAGLAVALLFVTGLAGVALVQRHDAVAARQTAVSRHLAAEALRLKDTAPGTAMLLSVAAFRTAPTTEARGALLSMAAYQVYQGELTGHGDAVSDVSFGKDGTLASAGSDQQVILWDTRSKTRRATLTDHPTFLRAVAFSPDGQQMATGGEDANLVLWDANRGQRLATLAGHTERIRDIKFSPDGRSVATSSNDRTVVLWDVRDRTAVRRLTGHQGVIQAVAFSPDGSIVATAGGDRTIGLWDTATGRRLATLTGHTASVDSVVFSPDGRTLASASTDYTIRLWDVTSHASVATLTGHTNQARAVAFSPDGRTLASAGHDHTVILWDVASRTVRARLTGHTNNIYALAFHPRLPLLASGEEQGRILLWNIDRAPLAGHTKTISATAYSPDGKTLVTASTDHTATLWDVDDRTPLATIRSRTGPANAVAFSHDGRWLAIGTGSPRHATGLADGGVMLLDVTDRARPTELATYTGHTDEVTGVAFTPDDRMLATASADESVILWDTHHHTKVAALPVGDAVNAVAISPDSRTLALSTGNAHRVTLWNLADRTKSATLTHPGLPREMAFSPDSRTLATVAADRTVTLWSVQRHEPTATFTHSDTLISMAFSPDGRLLVTGGAENTVGLWDSATGSRLATLSGHTGPVAAVAFAPGGHAVSSADARAITWTIDEDRAIRDICDIIHRELTREERDQFLPDADHPPTCP
ncbi:nSTAND1 domain-containing NTPase [Actinosynnema sp. ALI-1.44]|uniref:nSTAND1 domain-containing NTPase n=1 Tax=Actinosynnema sp. ALI-1.44 TaxID=1933779 RepID=UPI00143D52AA|nr:helix-turn-helix domain-containing protein [Actinosynnema sp. ALI-1.44]